MEIKDIIGIGVIVLLCLIIGCQKCVNDDQSDYLHNEMTTITNSNGQLVQKVQAIEYKNRKELKRFLQARFMDSTTIQLLQTKVNEYKGLLVNGGNSVVVFKDRVILDTFVNTIVNIRTDTIIGIDTIYKQYVDYSFEYRDKWVEFNASVDMDSSEFTLQSRNEYSIFINNKKGYVEVQSLNPYSKVEDIKMYSNKLKRKRFGLGVHVGYGINSQFQLRPYLGLGISYNLVSF